MLNFETVNIDDFKELNKDSDRAYFCKITQTKGKSIRINLNSIVPNHPNIKAGDSIYFYKRNGAIRMSFEPPINATFVAKEKPYYENRVQSTGNKYFRVLYPIAYHKNIPFSQKNFLQLHWNDKYKDYECVFIQI